SVMAAGEKRVRSEDGDDRISELPDNLREHILDCLSIKDAIATSVLSSKWRYCWTGQRKLKFDEDFWDFDGDFTLLEHARVIDRVLMLHSGPIREFVLYIPNMEYKTVDINMWLRVLSNNGVQKIEINAREYKEKRTAGPFPMPSCLFRCRDLEELSLCNFTLGLDSVEVAPDALGSLISGCPMLETLSLKDTDLEKPLPLKAPNLKNFYFDDSALENIIFKDVPKLTRPLPENFPSSTSTPLENLRALTLRSVNICFSDDILFTLCLLRSSPRLQELTIHLNAKVGCRHKIKKSKGAAVKLLESEAKKRILSCCSPHTIKIRGVEGLRHEILLIKILQMHYRKTMSIIIESGL
uniref:F-box domain-containing protein n=1 Tax=Kalanchoe fedtschenkoi TaxID=63787 RepID=A0A7N0UG28_KALFE